MAATVDRSLAQRTPASASESGSLKLTILLSAEILLVAILRIPYDLGLNAFAFGDRGSWLVVHYLASHGQRPGIDFGYSYGLLPIWFSAGWFGMFGATPRAYQSAMVICAIAMAWAIARMMRCFHLPLAGAALMLTALPFAIQTSYPTMAHAVEAALLCNALAEHAAGRRTRALALAAAACFAKPSMGYLYGFILIVFIVIDLYRRGLIRSGRADWREASRAMMPAAATVAALAIVLGTIYGPESLVMTLLPITGIKNYAAFNFGFFHGIGSYFWYGTPVLFYFGSVIGFWFAASLWLVVAGLIALWRLVRCNDESTRWRDEFVVSAAVLHVAFVTMFFGGPSSWSYYSYILVVGAMATCAANRVRMAIVGALALLAATGQTSDRTADFLFWKQRAPAADTEGLWAEPDVRKNLTAALGAIDGGKAALISAQGCAPLLFPQFERNDFAYLLPGIITNDQLDRALHEFSEAPMVVAVMAPDYGDALHYWPELKVMLFERELMLKNEFFAVYRKRGNR